MKSKLINFEVFFTRDNLTVEEATVITIKEDIDSAVELGYDCIIGLLLADGFLFKNNQFWNDLYNELVEYAYSKGIKKVFLLLGMSYENSVNAEQIHFNFHLHTVYNSYKNKELKSYNPESNKFLFLGGVPDRRNRIGLLRDLYNKNLLDNACWSFFKPWTIEQENNCLKYFNSHDEYYNFINKMERKIDDVYESSKTYGTTNPNSINTEELAQNKWSNDSSWIDPEIFASTGLSLISEGNPPIGNNNSKFLTEKTYRAFVQGHPFLLAANSDMFKYVKELGFKTFENYFPNKNYGLINDEEISINQLIENLEFFLNNKIDFKQDVEYNRNQFFKVANENLLVLEKLIQLGVDEQEVNFYFNRKGFGHLLRVIDKGK